MSKYENSVVGGTRTRTEKIEIKLPVGELPTISFIEQEVVLLADGSEKKVGGGRTISFQFDPTKEFAERNPNTDEELGAHGLAVELFAGVYSYIRQAQTDKDNEVVVTRPPYEPTVEPTVATTPDPFFDPVTEQ